MGSIEEGRGRLGNKIFVILEVKEELLMLLLNLGIVVVSVVSDLVFVGLWIVVFVVFVVAAAVVVVAAAVVAATVVVLRIILVASIPSVFR